ncbi:hypothetical protein OG607_14395 [Streptomyces sp. NBC_01537]
MSDNTEPVIDETEATPEVEAHSSVLDLQGKDPAKTESSCVSLVSVVEAK